MREYQMDIWNGIHLVKVKKNMVNPPTLPEDKRENTLQYVKSTPIVVNGFMQCENCKSRSKAEFRVKAKFTLDSHEISYWFCKRHRDLYINAFVDWCVDW